MFDCVFEVNKNKIEKSKFVVLAVKLSPKQTGYPDELWAVIEMRHNSSNSNKGLLYSKQVNIRK